MSQISTASNMTPALMQQTTAMRSQREQERANRARESIQASSIASRENIAAQDREATSQNYANLNEARALEAERDRTFQREKQRLAHEHAAKMVADTRQFALEQELRQGNFDLANSKARVGALTAMYNASYNFSAATRDQETQRRLAANSLTNVGESLIKAQGLTAILQESINNGMDRALFESGGFMGRNRGFFALALGESDTENIGEASEIAAYNLLVSQGVTPTDARRQIEEALGGFAFQGGSDERQEAYARLVNPYLDGLDEIDRFDAAHITAYTGVGESERGFRPITALVGNIFGGSKDVASDLDEVAVRDPREVMDYTIATVADVAAGQLGNIEAQDIYDFLKGAVNGNLDQGLVERMQADGHGPALGAIFQKFREGLGEKSLLLEKDRAGTSLGLLNIPGTTEVTNEERMTAARQYAGVLTQMYKDTNRAFGQFEAGESSLADQLGYMGLGETQELIRNITAIYEAGGGKKELMDHLSAIVDPKIREALTRAIEQADAARDPINQMDFFGPAMQQEAEAELAAQEEMIKELERLVEEGQSK